MVRQYYEAHMIKFDLKNKGAAMMIFIIFFMFASVSVVYVISRSIYNDLATHRVFVDAKMAYMTALAANEDIAYRFVSSQTPDMEEVMTLNGVVATTTVVLDSASDIYTLTSVANSNEAYRSSEIELAIGSGASFNFGVQTGNGGFEMSNGSSVRGNVFSNGSIRKVGGGNATIYGDAISSGPTGLIDAITATGSAWANTIINSSIIGTVYYENISNTSYGSAVYTTNEQPLATMPIADAKIDDWKQDIVDNGTVIASTDPRCSSGTYTRDTNITMGFVKIECNFVLKKKGSGTKLTLTGPIWVTGNIDFNGGPDVVIDPSVGARSVQIIADNESNRLTSGMVTIGQGTDFTGSGSPKSYVLVISQNNSEENGGTNNAINIGQSSAGDLLAYASHGRINMGNSISLKEVTGYKIILGNSAEIIYESGLVNLLFTSGPGGGFTISSWQEVE